MRTMENGTRLTKGVQQVEITFMWKDARLEHRQLPGACTGRRGGYVIQGKRLDAATRAQLRDLGADEDGVWVPADVIDRIKDRG